MAYTAQAARSIDDPRPGPDREPAPRVLLSVVSHGQADLVQGLLEDIRTGWDPDGLHLVLTQNLPEHEPPALRNLPFPVTVIRNLRPKGFAENHNTAFEAVASDYFCVLNPDIRCSDDPLPGLIDGLEHARDGLVAPQVIGPTGMPEDSARRRMTPVRILRRVLARGGDGDYELSHQPIQPDWVAGMFMLLRASAFRAVGGFDPRYRLYCEDADLCLRLWAGGWRVRLLPWVRAVHDARRQSHRDGRYLRWHVTSLLRFFVRHPIDRRSQT